MPTMTDDYKELKRRFAAIHVPAEEVDLATTVLVLGPANDRYIYLTSPSQQKDLTGDAVWHIGAFDIMTCDALDDEEYGAHTIEFDLLAAAMRMAERNGIAVR